MRISDWSSDVCSSDLVAGRMVRRSVRSGQSRSERVLTQRSCSLWVATVMIFSMRTPVVLGASLLLALPTASCSLLGDDGDPQATADMLAAALSAKDLADVPFDRKSTRLNSSH